MMKYENPKMEIIKLYGCDVIRTSGEGLDIGTGNDYSGEGSTSGSTSLNGKW